MMYTLVWSVYSIACLLALLCLFWLTAGFSSPVLRWMIRLPFVALCFTPVQVPTAEMFWLAPAIAAIAIDLVSGDVSAALNHLPQLLGSVALAAVAGLLLGMVLAKKS